MDRELGHGSLVSSLVKLCLPCSLSFVLLSRLTSAVLINPNEFWVPLSQSVGTHRFVYSYFCSLCFPQYRLICVECFHYQTSVFNMCYWSKVSPIRFHINIWEINKTLMTFLSPLWHSCCGWVCEKTSLQSAYRACCWFAAHACSWWVCTYRSGVHKMY